MMNESRIRSVLEESEETPGLRKEIEDEVRSLRAQQLYEELKERLMKLERYRYKRFTSEE